MFSSTFLSFFIVALALTSQLKLTQAATEHNGEIAFQDGSSLKNKLQLQDVHAREVAHIRSLKNQLQPEQERYVQGQQRKRRCSFWLEDGENC
eukprot:Awhi_evm1s1820